MIICSCAVITDTDIRRAVDWMRAADPYAVVTPGKVYRALGKSPECGGCIRLFVNSLRDDLNNDCPIELSALRVKKKETGSNEGRPLSHRVSEQGASQ